MDKSPREPNQHRVSSVVSDHTVDESLPKRFRLRHRSEIKKVQDQGRKFVSGSLVLMVLPSRQGFCRLGVTVSKKVGNAVTRARVKRRFREIFRRRRESLPGSCDLVIIARVSASEKDYWTLLGEFELAARQARRQLEPDPVTG